MNTYVVVGGGLAGLTAANALADQGNRVTLLERSAELGGRAQTQDKDGYLLNLGPHALYRGGHAAKTYQAWKIPFSGGAPSVESHGYFVWGEEMFPIPTGLGSLLTTKMLSAREKIEFVNLLRLFSAGKAKKKQSMADWLTDNIASERVRDLAAMLVRVSTFVVEQGDLDAGAALRQMALGLKENVLYLDGGWKTLVEGLAARAQSKGVEIRMNESIGSLQDLRNTRIVLAVSPHEVEKLIGLRISSGPAIYMASLDIAMEVLPAGRPHVAFAVDRPLYFSVHSVSARLAPLSGAVIHVAKYLGHAPEDAAVLRSELEAYAELILPNWKRYARATRFLPHLTVSSLVPGLSGRPGVLLPGFEGVAIAGDWVGAEGMLSDAAVASGLEAARALQMPRVAAA